MRRRDVIRLLGSTAAFGPLQARSQQSTRPVVGFLSSRSPSDSDYLVAAFRRGLGEAGYTEGQNIAIEFRWAHGRYGDLPALAADLLKQKIAVLAAVGGEPSALAAQAATSTIPIVFTIGGDPVKLGLVASMNRPGGNATGVSLLAIAPEPKRFSILHEVTPKQSVIGILVNPSFRDAEARIQELSQAARALDRRIAVARANNDAELDAALASFAEHRIGALLAAADPYFDTRRDRIIAFAHQFRLPTMYQFREFAAAGGLMTYGISLTDGYRQTGAYVAQVLKGGNPAELPVFQSIKFELVINLKVAKMLGIEIPAHLLALADEVIE